MLSVTLEFIPVFGERVGGIDETRGTVKLCSRGDCISELHNKVHIFATVVS